MAALLVASCGGGSGYSPPAAPSNLNYSQPPSFVVGTAIAPLKPTVTGTVSSYAVSPPLPAGLVLATDTGTISGTPTSVAPLTNYTVSASNAGGMTTATVAIAVNAIAPSISYGASTFTLTVAVLTPALTPTNTGGTPSTWSINPTLPAGLSFNTGTGVISGIPTAVAAPATYVVTAQNSGGKGTASLTLGVQAVLLDLGHVHQMSLLRLSSSRVLSLDETNYWILWNYATNAKITSAVTTCRSARCVTGRLPPVDMAGATIVDETAAGLEIRSGSDGTVQALITTPIAWWQLAADGSYVAGGSTSALTVWSLEGGVIASRAGDYSGAAVFAAPGQVQVALGPAGTNVVETVALPSGSAALSPAFLGNFNSWFVDGQRFLTNAGNTVWTYTSSGVQEDFATLSTVLNLTGQADWFWTYTNEAVNLYKVGASGALTATYPTPVLAPVIPSGLMLAILNGTGATVIDLSGPSPVTMNFTTPIASPTAYASSGSQWLLGNWAGVILDGTSIAGTPRYFGYGEALSIAGSSSLAAVATASGAILYFDAATGAQAGSISFASSQLALSSDGTVLAAAGDETNTNPQADWSIRVYSLPSAALVNTFPYTYGSSATLPLDISLSGSGTVLGQVLSGTACTRTLTSVMGGPVLWSDTLMSMFGCTAGDPVRISPDGTQMAVSTETMYPTSATNIYLNGTLVTATPGWVVSWLDDSRILVHNYGFMPGDPDPVYTGSTVYSASGAKLASLSLPLPAATSLQIVGTDSAYDPGSNAIYSTTTGQASWTSASPTTGRGAVAGSNVVFASGNQVVVQPY